MPKEGKARPGARPEPASKLVTLPATRVAPLLFFSGACALVYQVAWLRELRLIFGASTAASAAVLAVFMGGLGAGGVVLRRRIEASRAPLFTYAHLEILVAIASGATPALVWLARAVYLSLGGVATLGMFGATVVRLVLAVVVLGGPTLLMGGTLPAAARAVTKAGDVGRRGVAILYGTNTFGAVAGALCANFVLLEVFGTRLTLWMACLVNVLVGMVGRVVARTADEDEAAEPEPEPEVAAAAPTAPPPRWFPALAAGVTGFAFLLMELVWYRMLAPLLGGSSYTFGLILAVALAGIGLGGLVYSGKRRPQATMVGFGAVCALEALALIIPYAMGDRVAVFAALLRPLGAVGFHGHVIAWTAICSIVVLPAAVVAGYQFPMTISLFGTEQGQVAKHVALAYAANTVGSIVGSLAGGFGLLPALTAPGCWRASAWLLLGLGVGSAAFGYVKQGGARGRLVWSFTLASLTVLGLRALGPTAAWRHSPIGAGRIETLVKEGSLNVIHGFLHARRRDVTWEADGVESTVGIGTDTGYNFIVSGKSDGSALVDASTQIMSGLLGAALRPGARRSLVVGLGTGSTAGWLGALPDMDSVEVVELEPAIRHVAEVCKPVNHDVLANPKVHLSYGDAREYLLTTKNTYDLIFSEPSNPYRAGISGFFTVDFYRSISNRLSDQGVFLQWVQLYEVDGEVVRTALATMGAVFPNVSVWETQPGDSLLVATKEPLVIDADALRARLAEEPFPSAMRATWQMTDLEGFVAHHIATDTLVRQVKILEIEPNSDDRNVLECAFARNVGKGALSPALDIWRVSRARKTDRPVVRGAIDWDKVERRRMVMGSDVGRDAPTAGAPKDTIAYYNALIDWRSGSLKGAARSWRASGKAPETLFERRLVAESYAAVADEEAPAAIDALAAESPIEGELVRARYAVARKQVPEAIDHLDVALRGYRDVPWVDVGLATRAMDLIEHVASEPNARERLVDLLGQPFAVRALDQKRMTTRVRVVLPTSPACVGAFVALEPPLWDRRFLEQRADCYMRHDANRSKVAEADLRAFIEDSPSTFGAGVLDAPDVQMGTEIKKGD